MNILFLTIDNITSFDTRTIYMDLANKFIEHGHYVTVLSVCEKRYKKNDTKMRFCKQNGEVIRVVSPNVTQVSNYIKKGVSLVLLNWCLKKAVNKIIDQKNYDLVIYGSPPVTVYGAVSLVKRKQNAFSYLLLKDIWPYDCVFGGVLSTVGWKKVAFNILKQMARKLYSVSDAIGCMSPANIRFLIENEHKLDINKIEVNPNSVALFGSFLSDNEKFALREKYRIPKDKIVFVYGGNLGVAQGIDFALSAVNASKAVNEAFFVFVGDGTAKDKIAKANNSIDYNNLLFLPSMPKDEYDQFVYACDVGLVFLNHDCMAPNYPSRILSYMQAGLPILCATDTYTDVGKIAEDNGYGVWCESNDTNSFVSLVHLLINENKRLGMGTNSRNFFLTHYTSDVSYEIVMNRYRQVCK